MTRKQVEKYVRKQVPKWLFLLDFGTWEVSLKFKKLGGKKRNVYAQCTPTWQYKCIDITVNSDLLAKQGMPKAFIEKTIVHELSHARVGYAFSLVKWMFELLVKTAGYDKKDEMVKVARKILGRCLIDIEERHVAELELMPLVRQAIKEEA